jgi:hypothetical protein
MDFDSLLQHLQKIWKYNCVNEEFLKDFYDIDLNIRELTLVWNRGEAIELVKELHTKQPNDFWFYYFASFTKVFELEQYLEKYVNTNNPFAQYRYAEILLDEYGDSRLVEAKKYAQLSIDNGYYMGYCLMLKISYTDGHESTIDEYYETLNNKSKEKLLQNAIFILQKLEEIIGVNSDVRVNVYETLVVIYDFLEKIKYPVEDGKLSHRENSAIYNLYSDYGTFKHNIDTYKKICNDYMKLRQNLYKLQSMSLDEVVKSVISEYL